MPASTKLPIYTDTLPAVALLLSLQSSPRGCDSSWSPFPFYSPLMVSERSSPLSHRESLQKRQESRYKLEDKQELAGSVTVNTVTQKDWIYLGWYFHHWDQGQEQAAWAYDPSPGHPRWCYPPNVHIPTPHYRWGKWRTREGLHHEMLQTNQITSQSIK